MLSWIRRGFVYLSALLVFLTFSILPAQAMATRETSSNLPDEVLAKELLSYAELDESGNIIDFNLQRATDSGASQIVIDAATKYNSEFSSQRSLQSGASPQLSFPVHGNWCGPGHSGPGGPIDLLDSRCQTHDWCYGQKGYFNKACDRELVVFITLDLSQHKYSWWVAIKAKAIRAVFLPNSAL